MTDSYYDALVEISKQYLHEWIDAPYKHNFAESSEQWLRQRGFYDDIDIIPFPPFVRWRAMMGMPPKTTVKSYF